MNRYTFCIFWHTGAWPSAPGEMEGDMLIKLNDKYRIRGIPMNFVLEEKKIRQGGKNKGEEYWQESGYYPTLKSLLRGIATRHVQTTETEGIQLLIQEIKNGVQAIKQQIEVLEKG